MAESGENREQRIIDHEVRLSRTREIVEGYAAGRRARGESREAWRQAAWMRERLAGLIAGASLEELDSLGVTDQVVRELRLGASVQAVWRRLHSSPPPPTQLSPPGARRAPRARVRPRAARSLRPARRPPAAKAQYAGADLLWKNVTLWSSARRPAG